MMTRKCTNAVLFGVTIVLMGCSQGISTSPGVSDAPENERRTGHAQDTVNATMPSAGLNERESGAVIVGLNRRWIVSEEMSLKSTDFSSRVTLASRNPVFGRSGKYAKLKLRITEEIAPQKRSVGLLRTSGWE